MKKFFKILRKIIKILLKSILRLIIGIIVITGIILIVINNRTLKFYEDDNYNNKFTMNKNFKVKNGTEILLNLGEGTIIEKEIYKGEIYNKGVIKINLKKGIITFDGINFENSEIQGGYIETQNIMKLKKINLKDVKKAYKNGDIENGFEILRFFIDGEGIQYHENGQISDKRNYVNGLESGPYISYYKNGQIKNEGNYKNGEIDGIWTGYYSNGNIRYKGKYINGLEDGYGVNYYENGNIYNEGFYVNGIPNGTFTGYFEDGNIQWIKNGKSGKLDGKSIIYGDDGSYTEINANDGIGIITIYDEKNNIRIKYGFITDEYNNIIENGNYIYHFDNGKITEGNYINGLKDGTRTGYYSDKSIRFLGKFENGSGITLYYDKNGNFIGTGNDFYGFNQKNGNYELISNGLDISLYNNGQIYQISNYNNGELNGIQTGYYENGQIASICNYIDGVKIGTCTTYYENGQIMEKSEYENGINTLYGGFYELGKHDFYDESGNFLGSGEIKCLEYFDKNNSNYFHNPNDYEVCSNLSFKGFFFTYYPSFKIKQIEFLEDFRDNKYLFDKDNLFKKKYYKDYENGYYTNYYENGNIQKKGNYNNLKYIEYYENGNIKEENTDLKRVEYFKDGQIYSEGNYENGKRVGTRNRYLGDGSIGVSKDYGGNEKINN